MVILKIKKNIYFSNIIMAAIVIFFAILDKISKVGGFLKIKLAQMKTKIKCDAYHKKK